MFDIMGATLILIALEGGPPSRHAIRRCDAARCLHHADHCFSSSRAKGRTPVFGPHFVVSQYVDFISASFVVAGTSKGNVGPHFDTGRAGRLLHFVPLHARRETDSSVVVPRGHKRIALLLFVYLLVLPIAIVVLEMHYVVDIPVGFAIAALVILISDRSALRTGPHVPGAAAVVGAVTTLVDSRRSRKGSPTEADAGLHSAECAGAEADDSSHARCVRKAAHRLASVYRIRG